MKIKKEYILKNIAGENVVIYVGSNAADFRKVIKLNDTAAFMWNCLAEGKDFEKCASETADKYNISLDKAMDDTKKFAEKLIETGLAE